MIEPKETIKRYLYNIEDWEKGVANLKKWERLFIIGQKHACETLLECFEKSTVPAHWPTILPSFVGNKAKRASLEHPYRGNNILIKINEALEDFKQEE